jgi:hypothetical protein
MIDMSRYKVPGGQKAKDREERYNAKGEDVCNKSDDAREAGCEGG